MLNRVILGIAAATVLPLVAYMGICAYAASKMTRVGGDHPKGDKTPQTFGIDYRNVRFPARGDGLEIAGWYLPQPEVATAMIMVHGRDASKQDAVSGNFVGLAAALHRAGHAVLMIDLRGHGESAGERYSFGVYERRDVLGAVDWLLDHGFARGSIGVLGLSLGGASVIGATAEEPAIALLVVESTFAELSPLIEPNWKEESGLPGFFLPGVFLAARLLYGYDLSDVRPVVEFARIAPRPVLIIHCRSDETIDPSHAEQLKAALPSAQLSYFDGCEHAEIYRDFPQAYEELLIGFLGQHLN
jgi:pimeloyl-ACP methyl ester carboxylesterase